MNAASVVDVLWTPSVRTQSAVSLANVDRDSLETDSLAHVRRQPFCISQLDDIFVLFVGAIKEQWKDFTAFQMLYTLNFLGIACPLPNIPLNGRISGSRISFKYPLNSVVKFTCNPGFQLDGDATATCMSDSTWSTTNVACVGKPLVFKYDHCS